MGAAAARQIMESSSHRHDSVQPGHMVQLDGLRAFAVLGVMAFHFMPEARSTSPLAFLGVRLFFVLSGFLITSILLRGRTLVESNGQSTWFTMRRFYVRRFLRIFPLFYFVLFVTAVIHLPPVRETFWWHASYLSNVYFAINGWTGSVSHFWSLAVEEQFYLVWPWLILFLPRRRLVPVIGLIIVLAPLFRLVATLAGLNSIAVMVLPFSCLDTLGLGGLLAVSREPAFCGRLNANQLRKLGQWVGLPLLGVMLTLHFLDAGLLLRTALFDLAVALSSVWLISGAIKRFQDPVRRVLESSAVVYLGTISYGLYIYHNFVLALVPYWLERFGLTIPRPLRFWLLTTVTIAAAALSWHLLEKPINNLKVHFDYRHQPRSLAMRGTAVADGGVIVSGD